MKLIVCAVTALGLAAVPAIAQEQEKPKMCKMMHDGKEMHGMMVKSIDGKMICKMMDHSKMDQGKKDETAADKPGTAHKHN